MSEVCIMENNCVPGQPMNIKDKMLAAADMQRKAIEILAAIKHDVIGTEREDGPEPADTCMYDVAARSAAQMDYILELLCEIRDALGVTV